MKLVRKLTIILVVLLLCIELTVAGVYVNKIKEEYIESKIANTIIINADYSSDPPYFKEETELVHQQYGLVDLVKKRFIRLPNDMNRKYYLFDENHEYVDEYTDNWIYQKDIVQVTNNKLYPDLLVRLKFDNPSMYDKLYEIINSKGKIPHKMYIYPYTLEDDDFIHPTSVIIDDLIIGEKTDNELMEFDLREFKYANIHYTNFIHGDNEEIIDVKERIDLKKIIDKYATKDQLEKMVNNRMSGINDILMDGCKPFEYQNNHIEISFYQFTDGVDSKHPNPLFTIVVVGFVEKPLEYAIKQVAKDFSVIIVVSIICILIFSYCISELITRRVVDIEKKTKNIAEGHYNDVLEVKGKDELSSLSNSINIMSSTINNTMEQLNLKIEDISNLNNIQKKFIAQFTHEIKTPLGIISGFSELLENEHDENKKIEYIKVIQKEIKRIDALVYAMLDLDKYESGQVKLNKEDCDIEELVYKTLESFDYVIKQQNVKIELVLEPVCIKADEFKMEIVIRNLISNALKHTHDGLIKITLNQQGLSVENEGKHIPEDQLETIWLSFQKVDNETKGTGLGLAICKSILELHEFNYDVKNTDLGVEFNIRW